MGGYGSTRWNSERTRPVAEDGLILPLDHLLKVIRRIEQGEAAATYGTLHWSINGREIASIGYHVAAADSVTLYYAHTDRSGEKHDINLSVELDRVPRYYGGYQLYFLCPKCSRRSAKLYSPPGSPDFLCRVCTGVTYRSSNETRPRPFLFGHNLRPLDAYYKAERRMMGAKTKRARERAQKAYKRAMALFRD